MTDRNGRPETVEELLTRTSYELAAIFNILKRKGLIGEDEFLAELKRLRESVPPPADPDPYVIRG